MKNKLNATNIVLFLLCMMYFITYIDRVNIATAAPFIKEDLNLSNTDLGLALSAFAYPYALIQICGGFIGDKLGPRKMLLLVGVIFSAATIYTGLVGGLISLIVARILLGLGEGSAFPTATKAMSNWLPPGKRGFAQGITHSFSRLGNAVAPPIIVLLITTWGWRESFWIFGAISFIWVIVWTFYFRDNPKSHPKITKEELDQLPPYIGHNAEKKNEKVPWKILFKRISPVTLVDFCYGWTLWVYLTWLPTFLFTGYGLDIKKSALFSAGILFAGVIGDTLGGVISDKIYHRTGNLKLARRSLLVVGLLGSFVFLLPNLFIHDLTVIAICMSLAFFFLELTNAVLWAIPMDIAPKHAGTASGMMNTGFGIAGMISPVVFGYLIDLTNNWQVPFVLSVVLLFCGAMLSFRIDPSRTIDEDLPRNTLELLEDDTDSKKVGSAI